MSGLHADPTWLALAAAAGAGAVLTATTLRTVAKATWTEEHVELALTALVAGIATIGAVTGMWRVFTVALDLPPGWAALVCGVLELAMLVSALRARRSLRGEHGRVGVDGMAVWVLAAVSAILSAAEERGAVARAVRLILPLVAAWLWERSLAAERRSATGGGVAWRLTPARVAVWLRVADPARRSATDIDRDRRLARLTRQRLRVAVLESATVPGWLAVLTARPIRLAASRRRLTRQSLAAVAGLGLGRDVAVADSIRATVAAVVTLPAITDPATLSATASPQVPPRGGTDGGLVADRVSEPATSASGVADPAITSGQAPPPATATDVLVADTATPDAAGPAMDSQPSATLMADADDGAPAMAGPVAVAGSSVSAMSVADQVAWFARQLLRHPDRTVMEWSRQTGLSTRTVERRIAAVRATRQEDAS